MNWSLASRSIVAAFVVLGSSVAFAQQMPEPQREHAEMAREAGVWDAKVTLWPAPGAPAMQSTATETNTMLGGFWLQSRFEGDFAGESFTGASTLGYDPESGKYVSTWVDSMTPTLIVSRGSYDPASHTLTLLSEEHTCSITSKQKQLKMVTTYKDADHKHFEIHEKLAGADDWNKTMEIDYTRRKSPAS